MAKFKFRLQSYLSVREKLEDQKKNEYGQAMAHVETEKQKKIRIQLEKNQTVTDLRKNVSKRVDPLGIQRHNLYIDALKNREKEQGERVVVAEKNKNKKSQMKL